MFIKGCFPFIASNLLAEDCSWSYGEWSEWTNFGLGARSRVQTMPDGKCDPVSLVEDEEAVCRGSKLPLHCDENQFIEVTAVNYGTTNKCFCTSPDDEDCLANVLEDIQGHCNNRYSCELQDTDSVWEHFSGRSSGMIGRKHLSVIAKSGH